MKDFIRRYYKGKVNVINMDKVITFYKGKYEDLYLIHFVTEEKHRDWFFDEESDRDETYNKILEEFSYEI